MTALSNGNVLDWMHTLVMQTARTFGMDTRTGVTIASSADQVASHFAPADVSYLSDRLHLVASQSQRGEATTPVMIRGVVAGHGAMVGTRAWIGTGGSAPELRVFPTAFPAIWGRRLGIPTIVPGAP